MQNNSIISSTLCGYCGDQSCLNGTSYDRTVTPLDSINNEIDISNALTSNITDNYIENEDNNKEDEELN